MSKSWVMSQAQGESSESKPQEELWRWLNRSQSNALEELEPARAENGQDLSVDGATDLCHP